VIFCHKYCKYKISHGLRPSIYSPNDICVSPAYRMVEYTPLSMIKSGIDFQTAVNRSEKQVCWWNCWQINYAGARDITSVPRLLTLKYFSLRHKKEEKNLSFQDNAYSCLLQAWYEFCLLHTCLSPLELEYIIMKCNNFRRNIVLMQHQLWDFNPVKIK